MASLARRGGRPPRGRSLLLGAAFALAVAPSCRPGPAEQPQAARADGLTASGASSANAVPKGPVDGARNDFFAPEKIAALPAAERDRWRAYLAVSEQKSAADRATMDVELRALAQAKMKPAPFSKAFRVDERMTDDWFVTEEARRFADNILSFQTPSGGWSKHVDYSAAPRQKGQSYYSENDNWSYIATIDNDSTTEQLHFLARIHRAHAEERYRDAFVKGVEYLMAAQFPSGCWPQVFPLQGGYHDAATYNDDAIINVLRLLGEVAAGEVSFAPDELRQRARAGVDLGIDCVVKSQQVVKDKLAVWAQQHDPLTLAPVSARSYELVGLSGRESASTTLYLMSVPSPDASIVRAVHAAVDWFKAHEIFGYEYQGYELRRVEGAGPLWARLYEIGTDRPIFSNRDGVKRYEWNELVDRRRGYQWFTRAPAAVLTQYDAWAGTHARVDANR